MVYSVVKTLFWLAELRKRGLHEGAKKGKKGGRKEKQRPGEKATGIRVFEQGEQVISFCICEINYVSLTYALKTPDKMLRISTILGIQDLSIFSPIFPRRVFT